MAEIRAPSGGRTKIGNLQDSCQGWRGHRETRPIAPIQNNPSANILIETALKFGNITLMKYKSELDNFELKSKNEGTILWDNNIRSILDVIKNNLSDEMNTEIKNFIDNQDQELFTQTVFGNSYDFFKAFIEGKPENHAQKENETLTELLADSEGEGKIYKVTVFDSDNNILLMF